MLDQSKINKKLMHQLRDAPLKSIEELDNWLRVFLGVHLASVPIDDGNSAPLQFAWDIYKTALDGNLTADSVTNFLGLANRGGQKCARGDTMVSTSSGMMRLDEFRNSDVVGSFPNASKGIGLEHNGIQDIWRLETHSGYHFDGTYNHRISVYDNGVKYKILSEINEKDCVLLGGNGLTKGLSYGNFDVGYLIGVLIGDGCLTIKNSIQIEMQDVGVLNKIREIFEREFGIKYVLHFNKTNNCWKIRFTNKTFKSFLLTLGLKEVKAGEKSIPKCVWEGNRDMISGFLSGYFDTDGNLTWDVGRGGHCRFRWGIASDRLIDDLQILLINYGIKSHKSSCKFMAGLKSKAQKNKTYTSHNLVVNGIFAYKLLDHIRSYSTRPTRVKAFETAKKSNPNSLNGDTIPKDKIWGFVKNIQKYYIDNFKNKKDNKYYIRNKANIGGNYKLITRNKLYKFLDIYSMCNRCDSYIELKKFLDSGFFLEPVKRTFKTGERDAVYDISVPKNDNFLGNGIVVHNTLSCSAVITILLLHDRFRDIIHMASIAAQANVLFEVWLNKFVAMPHMDGVFPKFTMRRTVSHTGKMLTVTHGTMDAVNAHHGGTLIQDELDLTDPVVFDESKGMLVASRGRVPMNIMISSRKFAMGNIQTVLDKIDEDVEYAKRIHVHRWGQLETTRKCTEERSGKYGVDIMVNEDELLAIPYSNWKNLGPVDQKKFIGLKGYENCLKCGIFSFCKGNLKKQNDNPHLTPIDVTADYFRRESKEFFAAQRLNRRPPTKGLIYAFYDPFKHDKLDNEFAELITEDKNHNINSLDGMIDLIERLGMPLYMGVDFGYNEVAASLITVDKKHRIYIIDELVAYETSDAELALATYNKWGKYPINYIFPDVASPGGIKEMRKVWSSKCGICTTTVKDVDYGINLVRNKIVRPGTGEPALFIHKYRCKGTRYGFKNYRYKIDSKDSEPTENILKKYDHVLDSIRYVIATISGISPFSVSFGMGTSDSIQPVVTNDGLPTLIHAPTGEEMLKYANKNVGPSPQEENKEEPKKPGSFWFSVD